MDKFEKEFIPTADIKFLELCDEIDYWKAEAKRWKAEYDKMLKEYQDHIHNTYLDTQKGIAQALTFALHAQDDADGNLVIKKEDRKVIAKTYKPDSDDPSDS